MRLQTACKITRRTCGDGAQHGSRCTGGLDGSRHGNRPRCCHCRVRKQTAIGLRVMQPLNESKSQKLQYSRLFLSIHC